MTGLRKIVIGSDHAGYRLKEYLKAEIGKEGILFHDCGVFSEERSDYPVFIHPVARSVDQGEYATGIVICGTGNGAAMVANKYQKVRAAICWNVEIARLGRQHNDANILALPARFIRMEEALEITKVFLNTDFEGGRHIRRIEMIPVR